MAGYWPSSFFCVSIDRDEAEVHKHAKKELEQYPVILNGQAWSIKDFNLLIFSIVLAGQSPYHERAR